MPRPARPWFRFYVEAFTDDKLLRLTPTQRWLWVAVLGAARKSCEPGRLVIAEGEPTTAAELARFADVPVDDVWPALEQMRRYGMVTWDESGLIEVCRWAERQFESDNTAVRTAKHRSKERSKEQPNDVRGNGSDTETDTEKELAPAERPRDLIFDALVEVCAIDASQLTKSARGQINAACKQLRDIGASDEDVRRKADAYRAAYPGISLTPSALVKHWPALGSPTTIKPKMKPSGPESVLRERPDGTLERFYPGTGWVSAAG